jgi:hypothetical protein
VLSTRDINSPTIHPATTFACPLEHKSTHADRPLAGGRIPSLHQPFSSRARSLACSLDGPPYPAVDLPQRSRSGEHNGVSSSSSSSRTRDKGSRSSRMSVTVKELRVASQELDAGSTAGRVFVRLLPLTAAPSDPPSSSSSSAASCSSAPRSSAKGASPPRRTLPRLPAAALLADRPVAKARVSRQLRALIEREAAEDDSAASTSIRQPER